MTNGNLGRSQYDGEYNALVTMRDNKYSLSAFDDSIKTLRELQKSVIEGAMPVRAYTGISWVALRTLEYAISEANNGGSIDFQTIIPRKHSESKILSKN